MNKNLSNKLIKAIYNSEYKDNFIIEGSYALYEVLLKDKCDKKIKSRRLGISDLDVDIYKKLDEIYNQSKGISENYIEFLNTTLKNMFDNIILKSGSVKKYNYELIKSSVSKRTGNDTSWYHAKVKLDFNKLGEFSKQNIIDLDINFVKNKLNKRKHTILLQKDLIDVYTYDNEKYLANKLMAFDKHYKYYIGANTQMQKYGNVKKKLKQDYFDILQIKQYLFIDSLLVDKYLSIMGCELNYKECYDKVINKVKGL